MRPQSSGSFLRHVAASLLCAAGLALLCGCSSPKAAPQPQRKPAGADLKTIDDEKTAKKGTVKVSKPKAADLDTIPTLDATRLTTIPPPQEGAPLRNLFSFEEDPVVVAERKRQAEEAAERAKIAAEEAAKKRREQEEYTRLHPPPPQPPPINFEFLGYFGDPKKRIGVFANKGGSDILLALEGDKIFDKYTVKEIGYESAEIGFDNFKETKRIPLSASAAPGGKEK